jgi:hypothetical protein
MLGCKSLNHDSNFIKTDFFPVGVCRNYYGISKTQDADLITSRNRVKRRRSRTSQIRGETGMAADSKKIVCFARPYSEVN